MVARTEAKRIGSIAAFYAGIVVAGVVILRPSARFALIDEWAYALPAFRFGTSGTLEPDRTAVVPDLIPMLLGGASVTVFGRTMAVLRFWSLLSLWGLGVVTYLTARYLGCDWRWSGIAGGILIASPVAFPSGLIFMSDVPFAAFLALASLFTLRWWVRRTPRAAVSAGIAILLATTIRPQGVLLACAALILPLISSRYRSPSWLEAGAFLIPPSAALAGTAIWMSESADSTSIETYAARLSDFGLNDFLKLFFYLPAYSWLYLAFFALPLGMALVHVRRERRFSSRARLWVAAAFGPTLVLVLAFLGRRMPYMSWGSVMAANGIGGGDRPNLSSSFWWLVTLLVGISSAGVGIALVNGRERGSEEGVEKLAGPGSEELLLTAAAFQVLGAAPLGLALADSRVGYDRYLLPVAVLALPAVAARVSRVGGSRAVSLTAAVCVFIASLVGIQDWVRHREVTWEALESLQRKGVLEKEIDGGFEWVAFKVGPGEEAPSIERRDVPWHIREFAPSVDPVWVLSSRGRSGYEVVETIRWESWVRSGELYLLRRLPEGGNPVEPDT